MKNKKAELPFPFICWDCAESKGAKSQGAHTCWLNQCPYCEKDGKHISPITDYVWPKEFKVNYIWD